MNKRNDKGYYPTVSYQCAGDVSILELAGLIRDDAMVRAHWRPWVRGPVSGGDRTGIVFGDDTNIRVVDRRHACVIVRSA